MTELEAHLRSHPDDWQSWLVYADYLQDQGDVRGEIIALSHQLETAAETDGLEARIASLTREHLPRWSPELPPGVELQWRFGFVVGVSSGGGQELSELAAHTSCRFLQDLHLHDIVADDGVQDELDAWATHRPLRSLRLQRLFADVSMLAGHPKLRELRELHLHETGISERGALALAHARGLGALETLVLERVYVGDVQALLESDVLGALTRLEINEQAVGSGFAQARPPARLRHLGLRQASIGPNELQELAQGTVFSSLLSLGLRDNPLGSKGVLALARSSQMGSLQSLDLGQTRLGREALEALGRHPLRELTLSGNPPPPAGVDGLERHHLGPDGLAALLAGPGARDLRRLDLSKNRLPDAAVISLASAETLTELEFLDLSGNCLGHDALSALAHSTSLRSLRQLRLDPALGQARPALLQRYRVLR